MKISDLIEELTTALRSHGDVEVFVDAYSGLHDVEEAGVDADDTGFVIWICGVKDE